MFCDQLTGGERVQLENDKEVAYLALSPDGKQVAVYSDKLREPLRVWGTENGKCITTDGRNIRKSNVTIGGFRLGHGILAYGLGDGTIRIVGLEDSDME